MTWRKRTIQKNCTGCSKAMGHYVVKDDNGNAHDGTILCGTCADKIARQLNEHRTRI